jgi:hypothetical protein
MNFWKIFSMIKILPDLFYIFRVVLKFLIHWVINSDLVVYWYIQNYLKNVTQTDLIGLLITLAFFLSIYSIFNSTLEKTLLSTFTRFEKNAIDNILFVLKLEFFSSIYISQILTLCASNHTRQSHFWSQSLCDNIFVREGEIFWKSNNNTIINSITTLIEFD